MGSRSVYFFAGKINLRETKPVKQKNVMLILKGRYAPWPGAIHWTHIAVYSTENDDLVQTRDTRVESWSSVELVLRGCGCFVLLECLSGSYNFTVESFNTVFVPYSIPCVRRVLAAYSQQFVLMNVITFSYDSKNTLLTD